MSAQPVIVVDPGTTPIKLVESRNQFMDRLSFYLPEPLEKLINEITVAVEYSLKLEYQGALPDSRDIVNVTPQEVKP